jgi:hypothetical protein
MLRRRTCKACLIDCTEALGNIYENGSQTCNLKDKTYRDAQLGELARSVMVDHVPEHGVICRVNPQVRSVEKVKLILGSSHLKPQVVRLQRYHEDDDSE